MTTGADPTRDDRPSPRRGWPWDVWRAIKIVLFFAACGGLLGAIALVSGSLFHSYQAGQPVSTGGGGLVRASKIPQSFVVLLGIVFGGQDGAFWGATCSFLAIPFLIRRRLLGAALWWLPVHIAGILVLEYMPAIRDYGEGVEVLYAGVTSFVFLYVLFRPPLLRSHVRGYCDECEYDLTGNTSGACPECGTPVPAET